ncbi:unnamed protein product [Soboliphyme baturini]|uniref:SnoaL-like domain-containing protein n=1 Tax=Soboliphyme baturini TaxID=241478 RepID=A0A183ITV1_9BILA|nr:unnamed protein product [Soboliphyme baturini]
MTVKFFDVNLHSSTFLDVYLHCTFSDAAKQAIGKQYQVLMTGYQKADWNVAAQVYGPNCTIINPQHHSAKGKEGAVNYWKQLKEETGVKKIEIKCEEINGGGDWYFERGISKLCRDTPFEERRYLNIWRKYDGKMVIHSCLFITMPKVEEAKA